MKTSIPAAAALPLLAFAAACSGSPDRSEQQQAPRPPATPTSPAPSSAAGVSQHVSNGFINWTLEYPGEVAAIPALAKLIAEPSIATRKQVEAQAKTDMPERKKMGAPIGPYEVSSKAEAVGSPSRLLSLIVTSYQFAGGAHGLTGVSPVLWDREESRPIEFAALFANGLAALNGAFHDSYCAALDAERAKRRQGQPPSEMKDDPFTACPAWKELALIPEGAPGQPFDRIVVHADPYVAGPYVEGSYDIPVAVTSALIAAMEPDYRASFEAKP